MWPFAKTEMKWTAPRAFDRAFNALEWSPEVDRILLKMSVFFSFLLISCELMLAWIELTFPNPSKPPRPLARRLGFMPVWLLVFSAFIFGVARITMLVPSAYRILGGKILFERSNRKVDFKEIERAMLHDFGEFRILTIDTRDRGSLLLGAPANLDTVKLRSLFERHGIVCESSGFVCYWPSDKAVKHLQQLFASRQRQPKPRWTPKPRKRVERPAAIVLLRTVIVCLGLVGTLLCFGTFLRRSNADWDRKIAQFDLMRDATIEAKKAAGDAWPAIRQSYVGPLTAQGDLVHAAGSRTIRLAIFTAGFCYVAMMSILYFGLNACFIGIAAPGDQETGESPTSRFRGNRAESS